LIQTVPPSVIEHNSKELGVDLGSASFFLLSHEHLDHLGGAGALPEGKLAYVPEGTRSSLLRKFKVVEVNTTEEIPLSGDYFMVLNI
jgi:metal-dependent hydrolase (beta-lactamase superfamily II)